MKLLTRQHRPWVVYAGCSLMALALLTSNLRGGAAARFLEQQTLALLTPVYEAVDAALNAVRGIWTGYIFLVNLREENEFLRRKLLEEREKTAALTETAEAAQRYRRMLGFAERYPQAKIMADVIRRWSEHWNDTVLIGAGILDGIRPHMGVAAQNGVMGQVVRCGPHIAKVITILHPQSGVAALTQKSRINGIVTGSGSGTCLMKFASRFDRIILGETVVTSGLDGAFPKGLVIGRVVGIVRDPGDIFQAVEILPEIDMASVENVAVFLGAPSEEAEQP